MKKILLFVVAISLGLAMVPPTKAPKIEDSCKKETQILNGKEKLSPFRYEKIKTVAITMKEYAQLKEIIIPIYQEQQYRFVFNAEGMPADIEVEITDRPRDNKKAVVLYSGKAGTAESVMHETAEGEFYREVYVYLKIPPTEVIDPELIQKGCVVFLTGYKVF